MKIGSKTSEQILREALEVARDELKRVNDRYSCVRPDPFGAVIQALASVPFLAPIADASDDERRIVGRLVTDMLAAGLIITINNGGDDDEIKDCADAATIFATLAASDQDELVLEKDGQYAGWIRLVWGNDCSVISDYSTRLETVMAAANALAEELDT